MNNSKIFDLIVQQVDWIIVFLIISGGYFAGLYIQGVVFTRKNPAYDKTLKALLMGTFFVLVYLTILSLQNRLTKNIWGKTFISYVIATSFYDLILRPFNDFVMMGLTRLHNKISSFFGGNGNKKLPNKDETK